MFTYSHANTPLGQSERAYYLSYFINTNTTHAHKDLNKKLLHDNGRCNAAKKKLARVPAVSYKLISLVQARQVRSANDFSHGHKIRIYSNLKQD